MMGDDEIVKVQLHLGSTKIGLILEPRKMVIAKNQLHLPSFLPCMNDTLSYKLDTLSYEKFSYVNYFYYIYYVILITIVKIAK